MLQLLSCAGCKTTVIRPNDGTMHLCPACGTTLRLVGLARAGTPQPAMP